MERVPPSARRSRTRRSGGSSNHDSTPAVADVSSSVSQRGEDAASSIATLQHNSKRHRRNRKEKDAELSEKEEEEKEEEEEEETEEKESSTRLHHHHHQQHYPQQQHEQQGEAATTATMTIASALQHVENKDKDAVTAMTTTAIIAATTQPDLAPTAASPRPPECPLQAPDASLATTASEQQPVQLQEQDASAVLHSATIAPGTLSPAATVIASQPLPRLGSNVVVPSFDTIRVPAITAPSALAAGGLGWHVALAGGAGIPHVGPATGTSWPQATPWPSTAAPQAFGNSLAINLSAAVPPPLLTEFHMGILAAALQNYLSASASVGAPSAAAMMAPQASLLTALNPVVHAGQATHLFQLAQQQQQQQQLYHYQLHQQQLASLQQKAAAISTTIIRPSLDASMRDHAGISAPQTNPLMRQGVVNQPPCSSPPTSHHRARRRASASVSSNPQEGVDQSKAGHRCTYCDRTFGCSSNLRRHMNIHTGERPYRCSHCNAGFSNSSNRRKHERTHGTTTTQGWAKAAAAPSTTAHAGADSSRRDASISRKEGENEAGRSE